MAFSIWALTSPAGLNKEHFGLILEIWTVCVIKEPESLLQLREEKNKYLSLQPSVSQTQSHLPSLYFGYTSPVLILSPLSSNSTSDQQIASALPTPRLLPVCVHALYLVLVRKREWNNFSYLSYFYAIFILQTSHKQTPALFFLFLKNVNPQSPIASSCLSFFFFSFPLLFPLLLSKIQPTTTHQDMGIYL